MPEELKPDESASISRAETPAASANQLTIADCRMQIDFESAIRIQKSQIEGPVAQRNQSATLRRSRSHVQIVPGPPNHFRFLIADCQLVEEPSRCASIDNWQSAIGNGSAGVAQLGGGASLRN